MDVRVLPGQTDPQYPQRLNAGQIIIPSLQDTEDMWTLFTAAMLATEKLFSEAQYDIDAAFDKLAELQD